MRQISVFAYFVITTIIAALLISSGCNNGTSPVQRWIYTYPGQGEETGECIKQTYDNGYIIVGRTATEDNKKNSIYLLKIDMKGLVKWTRTFSDPDEMSGQSVLQTPDGSYLIVGYIHSYTNTDDFYPLWKGDSSVYLLKVNSQGDEQWNRR